MSCVSNEKKTDEGFVADVVYGECPESGKGKVLWNGFSGKGGKGGGDV